MICTTTTSDRPCATTVGMPRGVRDFHHSPSNLAESEGCSKVFGLRAGERLRECVGDHIFGSTGGKGSINWGIHTDYIVIF